MLRNLDFPKLPQTEAIHRILLGEFQPPFGAERLQEERVLDLVLVLIRQVYRFPSNGIRSSISDVSTASLHAT